MIFTALLMIGVPFLIISLLLAVVDFFVDSKKSRAILFVFRIPVVLIYYSFSVLMIVLAKPFALQLREVLFFTIFIVIQMILLWLVKGKKTLFRLVLNVAILLTPVVCIFVFTLLAVPFN